MNVKAWIEAMRLRTLPVSVAGVIIAAGLAVQIAGEVRWEVVALCLAFAVLAQISSNFANEYFDFKAGLDRKGRVGPRRGVTEGDITPRAMAAATGITLALACAVGCSLIMWGGWWLIAVGALIAVGVIAYSAGPYPLSHHALGEAAVMLFFGVIPVCFTFWLATGIALVPEVVLASVAAGLMGANVIMVNNYRDMDDDRAVGKRTLCVVAGRDTVGTVYLFSGYIATALMAPLWWTLPAWTWVFPAVYLVVHTILWLRLTSRTGIALNPLLGITALAMLFTAVTYALSAACALWL